MRKRRILVLVLLLSLGISLLVASIMKDSLNKTRSLVRVKCLGCLGLDPHREEGVELWGAYPEGYSGSESWREGKVPEHPEWILKELDKKRVVILFFWGEGCEPCKRQWEGMRDLGFVEGSERDGRIAEGYSQNVSLYSLDAGVPEYGKVYEIYIPPPGEVGVPMTVILIKAGGEVMWYSRVGYWEPEDLVLTIEEILTGEEGGQNG